MIKIPFYNLKILHFYLDDIIPYIDKRMLYNFHWQIVPKKLAKQEQQVYIQNKAEPIFERIKNEIAQKNIVNARVLYQYFKCIKKDEKIIVLDNENKELESFSFPKDIGAKKICLTDFFNEKEDIICFFAINIGTEFTKEEMKLKNNDKYVDYLYYNGFGIRLAEASALLFNKHIKEETGLSYMPVRYGFGYSLCPDMQALEKVFKLIKPSKIGMSLTDSFMMIPEQSVCGFVCFNRNQ